MKFLFLILITLLIPFGLFSQVCPGNDFSTSRSVNASFEQVKTNCSTDIGTFISSDGPLGWKSYSSVFGFPSYLSACSPLGSYNPLGNFHGTQSPLSGNSYVEIKAGPCIGLCETEELISEYSYVMQELSTPLIKGATYYIEFNVSLADQSYYGVNTLGLYLTDNSNELVPLNGSNNLSHLTPQIPNSFPAAAAYIDYIGWKRICGYFTPSKNGVKYLVLGNFSNATNYTRSNTPGYKGTSVSIPYYYVDDVYIREYSCCTEEQVFTNTNNLPSKTSVNNVITAGNNGSVSNTGVIVQSGQQVIFQAGKFISLLPGFTASSGSSFLAKIATCERGIDDNQLKVDIQSVSALPFGNQELISTVTGGSGNYIYEWSNGATTPSIIVPYAGGVIYTLLVTDIYANETTPCVGTVGWKEYVSQCPICRSDARMSSQQETRMNSLVKEIESGGDTVFSIYPNPSNGLLNIIVSNEGNKSVQVNILDSKGSIVAQSSTGNSNAMDMNLSHLPGGIYIVMVDNGANRYTKKLIINK